MDEQENGKTKRLISALLAGIALGLLMAVVLLFILRFANYPTHGILLILMVVVGCALPACADVPGIRLDLNLWMIEILMIGISFVMCLLYVQTAAMNDATRNMMLVPVCITHIVSMAVTAVRLLIRQRKRGSEQ